MVIEIEINPQPKIQVATDEILCYDGNAAFDITNPNTVNAAGEWRYDVTVNYPAGVAGDWVAGLNNMTTTGLAAITDNLTNNTDDVQTVTYTFTPHIDPGDGGGECSNGVPVIIEIEINPQPSIQVTTDEILCYDGDASFDITNPNSVNTTGEWRFDVSVVYPAGVTGDWSTGLTGVTATGISAISDNLTNTTDDIQTVTYIFTPHIDPGDGGGECGGGVPVVINVEINPQPKIQVVTDEILCYDGDAAFDVSNPNTVNMIGEWRYDVTVNYPPGVNGDWSTGLTNVTATGLSALTDDPTNTTNDVQTVTYTFTPHIEPGDGGSDCAGGVPVVVNVEINPQPKIQVATDEILCYDGDAAFDITNPNTVNTIGEWRYDVTVNYPGGVTGDWTGGLSDVTATGLSALTDNLTNTTDDIQTVTYTFTPHIDPGDGGGECSNGVPVIIEIEINPQPRIQVTTDEILCYDGDAAFDIINTNSVNVSGEWRYDVTVNYPVGVTGDWADGLRDVTSTGLSAITDYLTNTTNDVQTVTYTFTPHIRPGDGGSDCAGGVPVVVNIEINPQPKMQVTSDEVLCYDEDASFDITNRNTVNTTGEWRYDVTVNYPAGVTGDWSAGLTGVTATGLSALTDNLTNVTDDVQTVTYTFTPHIDPGDGGGECANGIPVVIEVEINPQPKINVNSDPILCYDGDASFDIDNPNTVNITGEWRYDVTVNYPAGVTGSWPTGLNNVTSTGLAVLTDNLTNTNDDVQTVTYTFTPHIGPGDNDGECPGGVPVIINIAVNPRPLIDVLFSPDTVLCNIDTINFTVSTGNGSVTGQWVYDVTFVSSDANAIQGESGVNDNTGNDFSQSLINTTDRLQWIDYTFTPKIKDPASGIDYCSNGLAYTVRIWLDPVPHLRVIAEDTIYCDTATVRFDVSNINGIIYGAKVYEMIIDYIPGTVTASFVPGNYVLEDPVAIFDQLVNNTDSLQEIRYTFRPKIWNPGGNSPGKHCDNGIDTSIVIYLNPTPRINALLLPDSVVCNSSDISIGFTEGNPRIIGERWYYLETETTGPVSGIKPQGLYPITDDIADHLVNDDRDLQIVTYHIRPVFRDANGHDQHCDNGIDTLIRIFVNPTPLFDSIYVSDTVICNESSVSFRFYNSQVTSGTVVYGLTSEYSVADIGGVQPDGSLYALAPGFTDTLSNISGIIQPVTYHFTPKINDPLRGLLCSNGIRESRVVRVVPSLGDTAVTPEYIGGHNIRCYSEANGSIRLSPTGGYYLKPYSYEWSSRGYPVGGNSPDLEDLEAGWYRYDITDAIGCSYSDSVLLTQPDTIEMSHSIKSVKCDGSTYYDGAVYVNVTGGVPAYYYTWSGPESFSSHQPDSITDLRSGVYDLVLTDVNMCSYIDSFDLPYPPQVTINPAVSHYGDYNISCSGLQNGWILSQVIGTGEPANFRYYWRNSHGVLVDTTQNLLNVPADNYNLYVLDSIGCYSSQMVLLREPSPLQIDRVGTQHAAGFDISCFGLSDGIIDLDISGSHSYRQNMTYSWTKTGNPLFSEPTEDISGLDTGTYVVMVTDTFNCTASANYTLVSPPEIQITVADSSDYSGYDISCKSFSDGMLDLTIAGGYGDFTYNWTTADGNLDDPASLDQSALSAGNYHLLATDAISCSREWDFNLDEPDTLHVDPVLSDYNAFNVSCFNSADGSIVLNPSGGAGSYSYTWTGEGTGLTAGSENQSDITSGQYRVELRDDNNCILTHDFTLSQPEALETVIVPRSINCFGVNEGAADLSVTGGISPYGYSWNTGAITEDIDSLFIGTYFLTVTDRNNCLAEDSTRVTEPPEILLSLNAPEKFNGRMVSCFGRSDGDIYSEVTGGVGTFRYSWLPGGETTPELVNVPAGNYRLSVTDDHECTVIDTIEVHQPQPVFTEIYPQDPTCFGYSDGEITLIPQGGTPEYDIDWQETGGSGQTADSIGAGLYHIRIKDLNNCILDTLTRIEQPDSLYITSEITQPDCPDKPNGGIIIFAHGGTAPYAYSWSDDSEGSYVEDLSEGTYIVHLTDNNQCNISDSIVLKSLRKSCLDIPTAFTPNGDGFNDTWEIENIYLYPDVIIEIYNRWGELIFRSDKGYDNPWDGTFRGRGTAHRFVLLYY